MENFSIYDHANKSLVYDQKTGTMENGFTDMQILTFSNRTDAERWKENDLSAGNYYNQPSTVYEVINN